MAFWDKIKTQIKNNKISLIISGIAVVIIAGMLFQGNLSQLFKGIVVWENPDPIGMNGPPAVVVPGIEATVTLKTPLPGVENISIEEGAATVVFDEANLDIDTDQDATVKNKLEGGPDLSTDDMTYDEDSKTLTIPYNELELGTAYKVIVPKETVRNGDTPLSRDINWAFTTVDDQNDIPPICEEGRDNNRDGAITCQDSSCAYSDTCNDFISNKLQVRFYKLQNQVPTEMVKDNLTNELAQISFDIEDLLIDGQQLKLESVTLHKDANLIQAAIPFLQEERKITMNLAQNNTVLVPGTYTYNANLFLLDENIIDKVVTGSFEIKSGNPPPPCVNNEVRNDNKEICKTNEWILCTAARENEKSLDETRQCKSGVWGIIANGDGGDNPPPPGDDDIKILKADAYPKGFNPLVNETQITYKVSATAKLEIKIIDYKGVTIVTLLDNEEIEAGEHHVWWNGTDSTESSGKVVPSGTYVFKVTAKDPESGEVKDIKSGEVNAIYTIAGATDGNDFEGQNGDQGQSSAGLTKTDLKATVSLQNSSSGVTAGTGPGVLIYLLFPAIGYIFTRRKNNK